MAVKETEIDIRVEVTPPSTWRERTVQQEFDAARELAAMIRRRLDDDERGSVTVASTTERVCEFCGRQWNEFSKTFNGGCCDKDVEGEDRRLESVVPK